MTSRDVIARCQRSLITCWQMLIASLRTLVGVASIGLIVVGIYGLAGWPWALIAAGTPAAAFYLWGETQAVRSQEEAN